MVLEKERFSSNKKYFLAKKGYLVIRNLFVLRYVPQFKSNFPAEGTGKRTCEANPAGENSLFILTIWVKSVPLHHFKLAYVVLHMAVKEFFEPTSKNREISLFNLESHF